MLEIPLRAFIPSPRITVQASLQYGIIPAEVKTERPVTVRNIGRLPAVVTVVPDRFLTGVSVPFASLSLPAGEEQTFKLGWTPTEGGEVRSQIEVRVQDSNQNPFVLPVAATVVVPQLQLLETKGGTARRVEFGALAVGESRVRELEVLNGNPSSVEWRASIALPTGEPVPEDPADPAQAIASCYTIEPSGGILEAFGRTRVRVIFKPTMERRGKGFMVQAVTEESESKEFSMQLAVSAVDGGRGHVGVPISGRAFPILCTVDPPEIDMGTANTASKTEVFSRITNHSKLPVRVSIANKAYFHVAPGSLDMQPGQTQQLVLTYQPRVLGRHHDVLEAVISSVTSGAELQRCTITVQGFCEKLVGGPELSHGPSTQRSGMKLGATSGTRRFDPGEIDEVTALIQLRTAFGGRLLPCLLLSREKRAVSLHQVPSGEALLNPSLTLSAEERSKLQANKEHYISFLRQSHATRTSAHSKSGRALNPEEDVRAVFELVPMLPLVSSSRLLRSAAGCRHVEPCGPEAPSAAPALCTRASAPG